MNSTQRPALSRRVSVLVFVALLLVPISSELFSIAGLEGTFEFGLDAPWRIEPNKKADGTIEYGAIPIQITIHDAMDSGLDNIFYYLGMAIK